MRLYETLSQNEKNLILKFEKVNNFVPNRELQECTFIPRTNFSTIPAKILNNRSRSRGDNRSSLQKSAGRGGDPVLLMESLNRRRTSRPRTIPVASPAAGALDRNDYSFANKDQMHDNFLQIPTLNPSSSRGEGHNSTP